ncbi:hypothetical protein HMPREF1869_00621 [Bacteroidales bacterium KA00251]|nr:hypothetical protein HMPREF1869_00621 [Bacteroidales bacterium KA00251]
MAHKYSFLQGYFIGVSPLHSLFLRGYSKRSRIATFVIGN